MRKIQHHADLVNGEVFVGDKELSFRDVYISGPLFTLGERAYLEQIADVCSAIGLSTYLPHRDVGFGPAIGEKAKQYFCEDLAMLQKSRYVVAVIDGSDTDSGTAWEVGFSYASRKRIIGIREDIRHSEINPMVACSLRLVHSLDELQMALKTLNTEDVEKTQ